MELNNKKTIGIVGGMGPAAGVYLQQLIIDATHVETDQDHIPVICYTNPAIPDRTNSLFCDQGNSFASAVIKSCRVLQAAGSDFIVIPCNTAHSKIDFIQAHIDVSILHMPQITVQTLQQSQAKRIGLLTTNGARDYRVFELQDQTIDWVYPTIDQQKMIMEVIYDTKKKISLKSLKQLSTVIDAIVLNGAEQVILGCTELSLYYTSICTKPVVDPLRILANHAVMKALSFDAKSMQKA